MAFENLARKTMIGAIDNFAKKENVDPNRISIVAHTKSEDMVPLYFFTIDGKPKRDEKGEIYKIHFRKDIIRQKMDVFGYEMVTGQFLTKKFEFFSKTMKKTPFTFYFRIAKQPNNTKDIKIDFYDQNTLVRTFDIYEIFSLN